MGSDLWNMTLNFFLSASVRGGKTGSTFMAGVGTGICVKGVATAEFVSGTLLNTGSGFVGIQLSSRDGRGAPVCYRQLKSFLKAPDLLTSDK